MFRQPFGRTIDDVQDVWAEPDPDRHILSIMLTGGYDAEVFKDGRHVFSRAISAGGVSLMEAGVRPRAVHRGRWEVLHLYLPAGLITALAIGEELVASAGAIELIDPKCAVDPVISRIGEHVVSEMRENAAAVEAED